MLVLTSLIKKQHWSSEYYIAVTLPYQVTAGNHRINLSRHARPVRIKRDVFRGSPAFAFSGIRILHALFFRKLSVCGLSVLGIPIAELSERGRFFRRKPLRTGISRKARSYVHPENHPIVRICQGGSAERTVFPDSPGEMFLIGIDQYFSALPVLPLPVRSLVCINLLLGAPLIESREESIRGHAAPPVPPPDRC